MIGKPPNASIAAAPFEERIKIESITQAQIAERIRRSYHQDALPATDGYIGRPADGGKKSLKCAAVLIPLTFFQDEWHLLYTRRTDTLNDHSGQVSFPGGQCDSDDKPTKELPCAKPKKRSV